MSYKDNETNIGKKWSDEEITDLKKELTVSIPISEIALSHKRSERAIELQGLNLANKFLTTELKDKESSDEKIYGFALHQIKEFVNFKEEQELKRKENYVTKKEDAGTGSVSDQDKTTGYKTSKIETTQPIKSQKIFGRNSKVSVRYEDGRILKDIKFKKVESDINTEKCTIIED